MNQIFLGQRAYGFAAGSRDLFRQADEGPHDRRSGDAGRAAEGALGQQPDRRTRARARTRQRYIIDRMLRERLHHRRSSTTRRKKQELKYRSASAQVAVHAEYVAETARQLVYAQYGDRRLHARPERLPHDQHPPSRRLAYRALRKGIMDYERRQYLSRPRGVRRPARRRRRGSTPASPRRWPEHPDNGDVDGRGRARGRRRRRSWPCCQSGEAVSITGEGLKPAQSGLSDKAGPKIADPPRRRDPHRPGRQGRLVASRSCPKSKARSSRWIRATARSAALVGGFDYQQEQVQPRDAGLAPAGLELQAVHLFGRAGEGLHAGDDRQRRAAVLRRRRHRQPALGAEELRRQVRRARCRCTRRWPSRRTWSRSACCRSIGPAYAQDWITRFGFDAEKHPAYPDDGAGRRLGDAAADGAAPTACSPTAATACNPRADPSASPTARAQVLCTGQPPAARRSRCGPSTRATPSSWTRLLQEVTRTRHGRARAGARWGAPTSTARPAPPTMRWTPGSPASSRRWSRWSGSATTPAQAGRPRNRRRAGAAGLDRLHGARAQGRAGAGADAARRRRQRRGRVDTTRNTRAAAACSSLGLEERCRQPASNGGRAQRHPRSVPALSAQRPALGARSDQKPAPARSATPAGCA